MVFYIKGNCRRRSSPQTDRHSSTHCNPGRSAGRRHSGRPKTETQPRGALPDPDSTPNIRPLQRQAGSLRFVSDLVAMHSKSGIPA